MRGVKRAARFAAVACLGVAAALLPACGRAEAGGASVGELRVFVAASVAHVIEPLAEAFGEERGIVVRINTAASSTLSRQIEHGARADVFLSANALWSDRLEAAGLLRAESRSDLLSNRLVVIAHAEGAGGGADDAAGTDAAGVLADAPGRVAVGDPDHVPAGMYAKAALVSLGMWGAVEPRLVPTKDTRAALRMVARNETELGVVYATDAASSEAVRVVARFDASLHPPIRYPVAVLKGARPGSGALVAYLRSPGSVEAFERARFEVLTPGKGERDGG